MKEENKKDAWTDEFGVKYSKDGIINAICGVFVLLFIFTGSSCRNQHMKNQCNKAIDDIDRYRLINGHLPSTLEEAGFINEFGTNEVYYQIISDSVYLISYINSSADYNMCYYSDTKEWHDGLR